MSPRTGRTDEPPCRDPGAAAAGRDAGSSCDGAETETDGLSRRVVIRSAAAKPAATGVTAATSVTAASSSATDDDGVRTVDAADSDDEALTGVTGANYIPTFAYTMYLLSSCAERGIRPIVVLFESPGNEPTEENRTEEEGYATHSPSRTWILGLRNWDGWARSPRHFTRRWAQEFSCDDRLLATEIVNEPGKPSGAGNRVDFANEMLDEVVQEAPDDPALTMGTETVDHAKHSDGEDFDGPLDFHQFHHNLPVDEDHMRNSLREARAHRERAGKPVFCTELQRTRARNRRAGSSRTCSRSPRRCGRPTTSSTSTATTSGNCCSSARTSSRRGAGRYDGLFRENGVPFDTGDYHAVKSGERHLPDSLYDDEQPYPEPDRRGG